MQDQTQSDGDGQGAVFDLKLSDSDLLNLIRRPVKDSETYWESTQKLKSVREANMNLWLPKHWQGKDYYDYQEEYLYQDPRIFVSVETVCAVINSRIPQPEVMPAQDTMVSAQLAQDLQKTLYAHSERYRTLDIFRTSFRNLLLKRVGYIKLRFDKNVGANGDIVPEVVPPEDIIVDKDARWGDNPRFIAHKIRNKTIEELINMFPDSREAILEMAGSTRRDKKGNLVAYKTTLAKKKDILEIWFKYYDQQVAGGVAWVDDGFRVVLGKIRNPNWIYEQKDGTASNLVEEPAPPIFPINYLNDGSSYIDQTSMVEQAAGLQRVLNKRGFQIMESAEQSGSGLIFNTDMIKKEDIAKLTGAPDERIGVKGNVNQAVTRITPPPLPNYVIEDKMDARNEINDIFAVHDITRGAASGSKTLGQDEMQQAQDYTRMDDLARALERTAAQYYRYLAQMMKVYYTEDHWFKATGEDGQFDHIVMRNDLIEDGIDVRVEAGSTLPVNKGQQQTFATNLAQLGLIDPLSLYEVGSGGLLPSPKKMLERFMSFKTNPMSFMTSVNDDDFDRQAFMDIQILNSGEVPDVPDEVSPEYLKFFNNYMLSGDFEKQPDIVKQLYAEYLNVAKDQAAKQMQAAMTQLPTPDEMNAQNDQAVVQAGKEKAIMSGAVPPQSPTGAPVPPNQPAPAQNPTPRPPISKQPTV